ncbi:hypothetical protein RF11_15934 [Thelohanellus kitauei]|uniref:Uncharacterized protein n=1 Tax=Thelohanellus kitauei TaxID=669202 RepID=A0A0C2MQ50_THEKT|nr:hypothetical protein RF11_15934 [Thelohanellus kitauei]
MSKMQVILFLFTAVLKLSLANDSTKLCQGVDDKIMVIVVNFFYSRDLPLDSDEVDPREGDFELDQMIRWIDHDLNCHVENFTKFLRHYLYNRIGNLFNYIPDCTDYYEKWLKDVEFVRVFDENMCKLRPWDNFFELENFLSYLKPKVVDAENFTRMIFSAQHNRDNAINDYYHASNIYSKQRLELLAFLTSHRDTNKRMYFEDSFLIKELQKHETLKQWTSHPYLFKILQCYLQSQNLDQFSNPFSRTFEFNVPSQKLATFTLFVGSVAVAMLIVWLIYYKRGILQRNKDVRIKAKNMYYEIQDNCITEV